MDYVLQERMVALDSLLLVTTRGCNLESHYSVGYKWEKMQLMMIAQKAKL